MPNSRGRLEKRIDTVLAFDDAVYDPPIYLRLLPNAPPHYDLLVLKANAT
jgi:hypothetical protein